jgi:hypothetical protein
VNKFLFQRQPILPHLKLTDYRSKSVISWFSFADAPGGFSEEIKEFRFWSSSITISLRCDFISMKIKQKETAGILQWVLV